MSTIGGKRIAKTRSYRAKLFKNGGSQALRLPKECRLPGDEVLVRREGDQLVIEPIDQGWSARFLALFRGPPAVTFPERVQGIQPARERFRG